MTVALTVTGVLAATPASAEPGPNLKVTATVQQGRWLPTDSIPIDLTITNTGDATAQQVKGYDSPQSGEYFQFAQNTWGDLEYRGNGTTFAPGESRTYRLHGSVGSLASGDPVLEIRVSGSAEADPSDNFTTVTVGLVPAGTTERVAGHLYADANRDGLPSPGEDVAGAQARIGGPGIPQDLVSVTDANGRFVIDGVPAGTQRYLFFWGLPDGWLVPYRPALRIDGSGPHTGIDNPIKRPLSEAIQASITLDKTSYQPGDAVKATVTLTNVGTVPLTGLYAACDPVGAANAVEVTPSNWGPFSPLTQAGSLAPGQRLVLDVAGKVPAKAPYFGSTHLHCLFEGKTHLNGPGATGQAKAPGMSGDSRGQLWQDKNGNYRPDPGEGLSNTTVTLTREGDKRLVSFARTDADGFATFRNVAMGEYLLHVTGSWRPAEHSMIYHYAPPHDFGWDFRVVPS
ncbi:hypothetical protein [Amycolatopsis sp. CB00013]|uniref:hypothetical protein n=1 Tax=Amycolatopsis sp. CB00013 TaxID=1703945 RepID=UPI001F51F5C3|nr:hypothetical protein [Amycolatopsis sp. CB00013]